MGALAPPAPAAPAAALLAVPTLLIQLGGLTSTAPEKASAVLKRWSVSPFGSEEAASSAGTAGGGHETMSTCESAEPRCAETVLVLGEAAAGGKTVGETCEKRIAASSPPAPTVETAISISPVASTDALGPILTFVEPSVGSWPFAAIASSSYSFQYRPSPPAPRFSLKPASFGSVHAD